MDYNKPDILLLKVSYNWFQVIKAHFISYGSSITNCWYTPFEENLSDKSDIVIKPGTLTLFLVEKGDKQIIVGGGYYLKKVYLDLNVCWYTFGVRSGYVTYQDFINRAEEYNADLSMPISCNLVSGTFIFTKTQILDVPEGFEFKFLKDHSQILLKSSSPIGKYLIKVSNQKRKEAIDYIGSDGTWPGIYYKATVHKTIENISEYRTELLGVYNATCAVTESHFIATLKAVNFQSMYDDRFLTIENGIILRADIAELFNKGFITFFYDASDILRVRLSQRMKEHFDPDYIKLDNKPLLLPEDKKFWPNKEYVKWHNTIRFENWLNSGEFSLIDFSSKYK